MLSVKGRHFVDASVMTYALDVSLGEKHRRAAALLKYLWHSRQGALSLGVLEDVARLLSESPQPLAMTDLKGFIEDMAHWRIYRPVSGDIGEALELAKRHKLPFDAAYDIQAAKQLSCAVFWSERATLANLSGMVEGLELRSLKHPEMS